MKQSLHSAPQQYIWVWAELCYSITFVKLQYIWLLPYCSAFIAQRGLWLFSALMHSNSVTHTAFWASSQFQSQAASSQAFKAAQCFLANTAMDSLK